MVKARTLYDAGYHAGINASIELVLKSVMASLYKHDWPTNALIEMKDDITDAIFFYCDHQDKLEEDIQIMEEAGIYIRFDGKR